MQCCDRLPGGSVFSAKEMNRFRSVLTFTSLIDVTVNPISSVRVKLLTICAATAVAVVWRMDSSALGGGGGAHGVLPL
jgi:hypothetical protein